MAPTVEEWASLAVLVGAAMCEEDVFGVRTTVFIEGVCKYIVGGIESAAPGRYCMFVKTY